jgi:protein ImuB
MSSRSAGTLDIFGAQGVLARKHLEADTVASLPAVACLELPAFRLQLLLRQRPEWRHHPAVVIDEDRPQGLILEANTIARRKGIHPGLRYAHALGLSRDLRAGVIPPHVLGAGLAHVIVQLRAFTPHIEPSADEPGLFWLDASGLDGLYGSSFDWALRLTDILEIETFVSFIAVGFTRFGTYAAVKSLGVEHVDHHASPHTAPPSFPSSNANAGMPPLAARIRVMTSHGAEHKLASAVPLTYLALPPTLRERLDRLSIRTLGELLTLPRAGLAKRWGPRVVELVRLLSGETLVPLAPTPEAPRRKAEVLLDYVERDATRLLVHIEALLSALVPSVAASSRKVTELVLTLGREGRRSRIAPSVSPETPKTSLQSTQLEHHRFRPAAPTNEMVLLLDLVRLRLERLAAAAITHADAPTPRSRSRQALPNTPAGFVLVAVELFDSAATPEQARFFTDAPHRDLAAAARALARIAAELGEDAVTRIAPREGHLPRAQQSLVRLAPDDLRLPSIAPESTKSTELPLATPPLIRRFHPLPEPLPARPRDLRNDGWPSRQLAQGPIIETSGPYLVSGGWWGATQTGQHTRHEVSRDYAFAETRRGDLLWIYYDRRRRRWFEEGGVG